MSHISEVNISLIHGELEHIRSHDGEKPFKCHWLGCGKGFARQHDCKRHEQELHAGLQAVYMVPFI